MSDTTTPVFYRIKDWYRRYENHRTRELGRLDWVPVPNHHDSDAFRTLMAKPRGLAVFGAWVLLLQVASRCRPRGVLARSNGEPHTPETIGRMTGASVKLLTEAFEVLASPEIGWIEPCTPESVGDIPPAVVGFAGDKRRAHGRIDRQLRSGAGVKTPLGILVERPEICQWCGTRPGLDAHSVTNIRAHHFLPYGSHDNDRTVLFVCRSCHGFFESGRYTTAMILERWPSAGDTRSSAGDTRAPAETLRSSRARENGMEEYTPPLPPSTEGGGLNGHRMTRAEKRKAEVLEHLPEDLA